MRNQQSIVHALYLSKPRKLMQSHSGPEQYTQNNSDAETLRAPSPLLGITKYQDTPQARAGREHYESGFHAGHAAMPIPANASGVFRQGWYAGDVQRRNDAGEVEQFIATCGQGSKCMKCKEVSSGLRKGCRCWPAGVYDPKGNERDGYRMEWGMLVVNGNKYHKFMSRTELLEARDSGKSIVDTLTGKPLRLADV